MDIPPHRPWTKEEDDLLIKLVMAKRKAREDTKNLIKEFDNWCSKHYQSQYIIEYLYLCNL